MTDQTLNASLMLNFGGNFATGLGKSEDALKSFSRNGKRHLSIVQRSAAVADKQVNRLLNRWVALATGGAIVAASKRVVDFDATLMQLAVDADITDKDLAKLKQQLFDVANAADIRVNPTQLSDGIAKINAQTGAVEVGIENLRTLGLVIRATGASGEDAGALIANFYEKFRVNDPDEILSLLDIAAKLGKDGAFELRNLATEGNTVATAYAATGRTGKVAAQEMLALLQIVRRSTPSAAEAATAFSRLISTLTSEKAGLLGDAGIQIWDPEQLKLGNKMARPVGNIVLDILKLTKADPEMLAQIFDTRALRAANAFALEFKATGGLPSLDEFMNVTGDGSQLLIDAARNAGTAKAAIQTLSNAAGRFADINLSKPIVDLAEAINKLDDSELQEIFETTKEWAKAIGIALVAYKTLRAGQKLSAFSKRSGGLNSAAGAAAGPIPVYVVNMAGGMRKQLGSKTGTAAGVGAGAAAAGSGVAGAAGAGAAGAGAKASKLARFGSKAGVLGGASLQVVGAGLIAFEIGNLINHHLIQNKATGRGIDKALTASGLIDFLVADSKVQLADRDSATTKIELDVSPELSRLVRINSTNTDANIELSGSNMSTQ